ncbi:MAG: 3-isopropylmalate dehydratase small subunit [Fimbriimonadaceae bacterium]|nr:3-isopropylmalate dehydratase small subunit [Fimbriimonadaceae bacterium]QYK54900.1 MAG: 3-isopropylmalate dehydratase small subunit [Fimbriimonadaceae bacterium]
MQAFLSHTGRLAVYDADQVDTDRIIPARFLSRVERSGYGELLFKDVRGSDFPLDHPAAAGATILVTGTNFGCGSSREHAVWAIQQAGFKAVVARKDSDSAGFSDIFRSNAGNCGLCLVELDPASHAQLVAAGSGAEATVDLQAREVRLAGQSFPFSMNETTRQQLMAGLDLIGTTLVHGGAIDQFEQRWDSFAPASRAVSP